MRSTGGWVNCVVRRGWLRGWTGSGRRCWSRFWSRSWLRWSRLRLRLRPRRRCSIIHESLIPVINTGLIQQLFHNVSQCIVLELPKHHRRPPIMLLVKLPQPPSQICRLHIPCVHNISHGRRLTQHNLFRRYTSINQLLNRSPTENTSCLDEQLLIRVITSIALVVKLHIIKVDCVAHSVVDRLVCAVAVVLFFEVWGLWTVSDDMIGQKRAELGLKRDQPLLTCSCLHCGIVLPVNIYSIKIVVQDE